MKKKLLLNFILCIFPLACYAQNDVKRFEFEVSVGATISLGHYVADNGIGPAIALEPRYNFDHSPFDIGWEIYLGTAMRHYNRKETSNRTFSTMCFGDYNFNRGKNISPFLGLGIGTAQCDEIEGSDEINSYGSNQHFIISPRIGVELDRHLRITGYAKFSQKWYNLAGISIGYAFGGGKVKNTNKNTK